MILKWALDYDGGGTIISFKRGTSPSMVRVEKEQKRVFESLDGLPEPWAEAIRADGRLYGELELADELEADDS